MEPEDDIFIPENVFILEETVQEEERTVSTACQTDPRVPECSCAAVEERSTGTITKELGAQLDCAHDHQYTTEACPYTPQMELTESEINEDQNSLYEPESSESQCEPKYTIEECVQDLKYILFYSKLKELFNVCHEPGCQAGVISSSPKINSFAITMETECVVGHRRKWESQTRVVKLFAGNLLLSSAVFLTGGSHSTFAETCHHLSLVSMLLRQFANQQRIYIVPEDNYMWTQHTEANLATIVDSPCIISGDTWCDSPGHCASFGTYTILDSASHLILAQETVHVTEVKSSYWLETEGLERCLQHIESHGCSIETLATDRHPSVRVHLRDSHADTWHEYDLWNIAKGVRKQLVFIRKPERMV
eukprot:XP_013987687.1 PREDICTED: uncharacterized protein LOC106565277 isoform X3 [Salmo salar]